MNIDNNECCAKKRIKIGKITALISFLIGTAIFGLYFWTLASEFLFVGYGFIVIAGLVNIIILAIVLITPYKEKKIRKKILLTGGVMLLNIPIMLIYCSMAIILTNTMRISFINTTNMVLKDINIIGCESKHIEKLEKGESKTVWVGINGDCTININYIANGERKEENVTDYVTTGMGQRMKYNIGVVNSTAHQLKKLKIHSRLGILWLVNLKTIKG